MVEPIKSNSPRTKTEWWYWIFALGFSVLAADCFRRGFRASPGDRGWELGAGVVFATFGFGGIAWPILQRRETKGTQTRFIHLFDLHCEALFIPASRAKQLIVLAGSALLAVGLSGLVFSGELGLNLIKAVLAFAIYAGVFIVGLRSVWKEPKGIFLVPRGMVWCEMFRSPCFIPWETVSAVAAYSKQETDVTRPTPAFGLDVSDLDAVQTTKGTRRLCHQSKTYEGWHFVFLEESLVVPAGVVESLIRYYREHPEARGEIGTESARKRAQQFELTAAG